MRKALLTVLTCALLAVSGCSSDDGGDGDTTTTSPGGQDGGASSTGPEVEPADVTVTGPLTGGTYGVPSNPAPPELLDEMGYVEEEYVIGGSADSFTAAAPLDASGEWAVEPGPEADYRTRIVVRRPTDPERFDGTVVVEWLNVTAGRDSDPDWGFLHPFLGREGWAYVGVSAQLVGVEGGDTVLEVPGVPEVALLPLKEWDPERYAELSHPGDEWSYGIFSDVGRLLRAPDDLDPLDGLRPETLIAVGESQSAARMVTYVDAVHPVDDVYDGFVVHSRGSSSAPLGIGADEAPPDPAFLRTDLDDPVLVVQTETDLLRLGSVASRQDDTDVVRTWEIAGTAHADEATIDYGRESGQVWLGETDADPTGQCGLINDGPQGEVLRAALHHLSAWIADGTVPPASPRIEVVDGDIPLGENDNALGGIRTPAVDAPISALSGKGNPVSVFCSLFGQRRMFTDAELADLYADHDAYVAAVEASADRAVDDGFLLPEERDAMVATAEDADVP